MSNVCKRDFSALNHLFGYILVLLSALGSCWGLEAVAAELPKVGGQICWKVSVSTANIASSANAVPYQEHYCNDTGGEVGYIEFVTDKTDSRFGKLKYAETSDFSASGKLEKRTSGVVYPNGKIETTYYEYFYDADQRQTKSVVKSTTGNIGTSTQNIYNGSGRLVKELYYRGTVFWQTTLLDYDGDGRITSKTFYYKGTDNKTGEETYAYGGRCRDKPIKVTNTLNTKEPGEQTLKATTTEYLYDEQCRPEKATETANYNRPGKAKMMVYFYEYLR